MPPAGRAPQWDHSPRLHLTKGWSNLTWITYLHLDDPLHASTLSKEGGPPLKRGSENYF
jgi:hypothetical protein